MDYFNREFKYERLAIISAFDISSLPSTLYDALHLYLISKYWLDISNINIFVDNRSKFFTFIKGELTRLLKKPDISTHIHKYHNNNDNNIIVNTIINTINVIEIKNKNDFFNNIRNITKDLTIDDEVLFSLASHGYTGSYNVNNNTDKDGADEYFRIKSDIITDNDMYNELVLKVKGKLILLIDTCCSGTMLDLPYVLNVKTGQIYNENQLKSDANVIMYSACSDRESNNDSISINMGFNGGLTSIFIDYIISNKCNKINTKELYNYIKNNMHCSTPLISSSKLELLNN